MSAFATGVGRMGAAVRWARARPELRQVTVLASGSVIAQALTIAAIPLLSRIYAPSDFGALASLLAISTIGGSIGALCYETAIMIPRSQRSATALFTLSLHLSWIVAGLVTAAIAGLAVTLPIEAARDPTFLVSLYLCTAFTTLFNALGYVHSRADQFRSVAASKVNQSWATSVFQIVLGLTPLHAVGLLLGRVGGMVLSVAGLMRDLPRGFQLADIKRTTLQAERVAARSYRDFILNVPRQLLVRGGTSLPAVMILASYGAVPAGFYFFGVRLVERPGALLGDALTRVPMRQFAERRMAGKMLTRPTLLYTAAIALPIVLATALLVLTARPLFGFVLGAQWIPAADYSVVLAVWASVRLISLPASSLIAVLRIQATSLVIDAIFFTRIFAIPVMAAQGASALAAVSVFCAISIIYHLIIFAIGLSAAMHYDRTLKAAEASLVLKGSSHV